MVSSRKAKEACALLLQRGDNRTKTSGARARDDKDNPVLATALTAHCEMIITGDKDLLVLHPYKRISIITPMQILQRSKKH